MWEEREEEDDGQRKKKKKNLMFNLGSKLWTLKSLAIPTSGLLHSTSDHRSLTWGLWASGYTGIS
jgi:hypothetical protein